MDLGTIQYMRFLLDGDVLLMDGDQISMLILLALPFAFETIDHEVLLTCLWMTVLLLNGFILSLRAILEGAAGQ